LRGCETLAHFQGRWLTPGTDAGNKPHLAFEGGQTPLRRRLPKRGFVNTCVAPHKRDAAALRMATLQPRPR
jgi:ribosomal protein L15